MAPLPSQEKGRRWRYNCPPPVHCSVGGSPDGNTEARLSALPGQAGLRPSCSRRLLRPLLGLPAILADHQTGPPTGRGARIDGRPRAAPPRAVVALAGGRDRPPLCGNSCLAVVAGLFPT